MHLTVAGGGRRTALGGTLPKSSAASLLPPRPQPGGSCTRSTRRRVRAAVRASLAELSRLPSGEGGTALFWTAYASSGALTALLLLRHLMSWHPRVEKRRREVPWVYVKKGTDAFLTPLRALLESHAPELQERLSARLTTVDKRPEWTGGVDLSPVLALCFLRIVTEGLQPDTPLFPLGLPSGGETALVQLIMTQELALITAWAAICAYPLSIPPHPLSDAAVRAQSCAGAPSSKP